MEKIKNMKLEDLLELLSTHTVTYTRLMGTGNKTPEFEDAKKWIKLIQDEIYLRGAVEEGQTIRMHNSPHIGPNEHKQIS